MAETSGNPNHSSTKVESVTATKVRFALLATGLVVVSLAPIVPFRLLGLGAASLAIAFAGFTGLLSGFSFGARFAVLVAVVTAVFQFVAFEVSSHSIAAGLVMAVAALLYGLTSRRGATSSIVCAPIAILITLTLPPATLTGHTTMVTALVLALGAVIGGVWGSFIGMRAARLVKLPEPIGVSAPIAWIYAVAMAIVTGVAMAIVLGTGTHKGGEWLVLTFFVVGQPNEHGTWTKTLQRFGGTAIGFAIVFVVIVLITSSVIIAILATLFAIAAVVARLESRPYWQYVIVLTPAVVFAEGGATDVMHLDVLRLEYTMLGAVIALAVLAALRLASDRSAWLKRAIDDSA